jgi:hypothetical protein
VISRCGYSSSFAKTLCLVPATLPSVPAPTTETTRLSFGPSHNDQQPFSIEAIGDNKHSHSCSFTRNRSNQRLPPALVQCRANPLALLKCRLIGGTLAFIATLIVLSRKDHPVRKTRWVTNLALPGEACTGISPPSHRGVLETTALHSYGTLYYSLFSLLLLNSRTLATCLSWPRHPGWKMIARAILTFLFLQDRVVHVHVVLHRGQIFVPQQLL